MSGSETQKTEVPAWLEGAARENIGYGNDVAGLGYTPYYGPDVAAFSPMQQASFQNTGQAANAFGMAGGGMTGMEGMPQPQQFAGGVTGYSSAPMYEQALAQLEANNPGQFAAIQNMFIDPQAGGGGYQAQAPQAAVQEQMQRRGGGGGGNSYYRPTSTRENPYTSFGDMFDRGGPGASGGAFKGAGLISSAANKLTGRGTSQPTLNKGY